MTCALLASRAPSAKMSVCITPAILWISYTICCFLCAFHAPSTFFYKRSFHVLKKCSPPSVGSMILKAAQKQNHETYASWALQLGQYAPFLHHLLHPEICKINWKNVHFLFMTPSRKLYSASSALSHAFKVTFPHFRIASGIILWKNARRPRWEAWFWKRHKSKIMKHLPLGSSSYANMHPFCTIYCTSNFAKSMGEIVCFVYAPFWEAILSIVCFIGCI